MNDKIIHNYNPATGEYINSSVAAKDPMNPERFLIPLYATEIEPPELVENKARVIVNDEWKYVDDYRGVRVDAQDGSKRFAIITELGIAPDSIIFETIAQPEEDPKRVSKVATLEEQVAAIMRYLVTLPDIPEELRNIALHASK